MSQIKRTDFHLNFTAGKLPLTGRPLRVLTWSGERFRLALRRESATSCSPSLSSLTSEQREAPVTLSQAKVVLLTVDRPTAKTSAGSTSSCRRLETVASMHSTTLEQTLFLCTFSVAF